MEEANKIAKKASAGEVKVMSSQLASLQADMVALVRDMQVTFMFSSASFVLRSIFPLGCFLLWVVCKYAQFINPDEFHLC
jgi:hypothetical protein